MTATQTGMATGAVLALTWVVFGFWAFFFVGIAVGVGALIGRYADGRLDVAGLAAALRGGRRSS